MKLVTSNKIKFLPVCNSVNYVMSQLDLVTLYTINFFSSVLLFFLHCCKFWNVLTFFSFFPGQCNSSRFPEVYTRWWSWPYQEKSATFSRRWRGTSKRVLFFRVTCEQARRASADTLFLSSPTSSKTASFRSDNHCFNANMQVVVMKNIVL